MLSAKEQYFFGGTVRLFRILQLKSKIVYIGSAAALPNHVVITETGTVAILNSSISGGNPKNCRRSGKANVYYVHVARIVALRDPLI